MPPRQPVLQGAQGIFSIGSERPVKAVVADDDVAAGCAGKPRAQSSLAPSIPVAAEQRPCDDLCEAALPERRAELRASRPPGRAHQRRPYAGSLLNRSLTSHELGDDMTPRCEDEIGMRVRVVPDGVAACRYLAPNASMG